MKNLLKSTILFVLALTLSFSSVSAQTKPLTGMCIALVHGIMGFDDTQGLAGGLVKYWGGLDGYLRDQGAKVTTPGSSPMNSIAVRSTMTRDAINTWMAANACTKIHLIGHSQGGLVVRYITKNLGFSAKVASVSTVDATHLGTPVADVVMTVIPNWMEPFLGYALNSFSKLFYGKKPMDIIAMGKSLTVSTAKTFNTSTTNVAGMRYYSYGATMAWADVIQHPVMGLTYPITWAGGLFYGMGGANDGIVPLSSQKWGTWKGEPSSYWFATGIDHLQVTNCEWGGQAFFDVQGWYKTIALNVK